MAIATELYQTEYSNNLLSRYQQTTSRLMPYVMVEDFDGERKDFPRLSKAPDPTDISAVARGSATPYRDADFDKRWVYPTFWEEVTHFAQWDDKLLGKIALPGSNVQSEHVKAFMRQFDKVIIDAARGNVKVGKLGTTDSALPAGQIIAAGGTGMTMAKLLTVLDILDSSQAFQAGDGERVLAWTVKQRSELLNDTKVQSSDYNTVKALSEGRLDTFMGFKFVLVDAALLPKVSTTRTLVAFQKGAMVATRHMKPSDVGPRRDLRNALQIYDTGSMGAARLHDEGVVTIDVVEA